MNVTYHPLLAFQNRDTNEKYWPSLSFRLGTTIAERSDCPARIMAIGLTFAAIIDLLSFTLRAAITPTCLLGGLLHTEWQKSNSWQKGLLFLGGILLEVIALAYTPINVAIQIVIALGHVLRSLCATAVGIARPDSQLFRFLAQVSKDELLENIL